VKWRYRVRLCSSSLAASSLVASLVLVGPALAEDSDIDRIPQSTPSPPVETAASDPDTQLYLQDDLELAARKSDLAVPIPPPLPARWEERLFFDARIKRTLTDDLDFIYGGRFNLRAEEGLAVPDHEDVRNDLREAYLAWSNGGTIFADLGRINLKSGVALGFNPTDFFKTRAVVEPLSADPSALREDRLGTLMAMGEEIWTGGSLTIAFAPKLYGRTAIYGNTIIFTAEGDLWQVSTEGGVARRLTTHPGEEKNAAFSPDGKTIAFSADYEGPTEVYTMPAAGGLPSRRTFEGGEATVVGWTPDGKILYTTRRYSTLPDSQLATIDAQNHVTLIPLSQAAQGSYDARGMTLYFTRMPFQGSYAKRYQGGTAQKIWKYTGGAEAVSLTNDFAGTSKDAMWWNGRIYFLSDRDGTMNLWSMDENGRNLRQHTRHAGWDAKTASMARCRCCSLLGRADCSRGSFKSNWPARYANAPRSVSDQCSFAACFFQE